MNDQSRIGADRYRDQAVKAFNECFREPDPVKYKERGCDKEPKGKQVGGEICCQRDAYQLFSHSERLLFRDVLFKEYWNGLSQFVVRRSLCSEIWRTTMNCEIL